MRWRTAPTAVRLYVFGNLDHAILRFLHLLPNTVRKDVPQMADLLFVGAAQFLNDLETFQLFGVASVVIVPLLIPKQLFALPALFRL